MALEEGKVSLDDSFFCGGSVQVQGRTNPVRCWKTSGHGSQSLHTGRAAFVQRSVRQYRNARRRAGFINTAMPSAWAYRRQLAAAHRQDRH